jgi:hypothetical protein
MESVATSVHLPPVDNPHEREAVGNELQLVLHELVDLPDRQAVALDRRRAGRAERAPVRR